MSAASSRLQAALAERAQVWGGWVVGPTILGPEEFATAGYDYVGFDTQHGYLDDADVALMLRRLERVPIATAVRLPSAAPAPIGRVLDAGADAVIVAMVETPEQAAQAVAATRYAPAGVRSFGPLRADLGLDTPALEARAGVYAMVETAAALPNVAEICSVPGLSGVYVGPADLAVSMGQPVSAMWSAPRSPTPSRTSPAVPPRRVWSRASTPATAGSESWPPSGAFSSSRLPRSPRRCAAARPSTCATPAGRPRPPRPPRRGTAEMTGTDRIALVTGAARGQGAAIVARLRRDGFAVAACDVQADELEAAVAALDDPGVIAVPLDVTSEEQWSRAVEQVASRLGLLTTLVNNAGVLHRAALADETAAGFENAWRVNCLGPFLGIRLACPRCGRRTARPSSTPAAPARCAPSRTTPPTDPRSGRCAG